MPLPFRLPFQRQKRPINTQDLEDFHRPSPAFTILHLTEDTGWYPAVPQDHHEGPEPASLNRSKSNPQKFMFPPVRLFQRGKRWHDSVSDEQCGLNDTTWAEKIDTTPRLRALRARMKEEQIDYYVIPSEDGHLSAYTAPSERRCEWISGFRGSAGTAVISRFSAYLFTDSRYWVQAQRELDTNWSLQKVGWQGTKDWLEWVVLCPRGSRIGIDARMIAHQHAIRLFKGLYDRGGRLVHPRVNLVDLSWREKPEKPKAAVYIHLEDHTGKGPWRKLSEIRRWVRDQNAAVSERVESPFSVSASTANKGTTTAPNVTKQDSEASDEMLNNSNPSSTPMPGQNPNEKIVAVFISNLSEVAYTLNLRGSDVPYNPVFTAYLLVAQDQAVLFIDSDKISAEVKTYLTNCGVSLRTYADIWNYLRNRAWGEGKIIINPNTPYAVSLITGSARCVVLPSFLEEQRAIKNETEIQGFRSACLKDGAAMCRWFSWLDKQFRNGVKLTEYEASERLDNLRTEMPLYVGLAHENVSATGPNAALPHYTPSKVDARYIAEDTPYLIDSGGQYYDGTCDTTRTVHFGRPAAEQCEAFTRVLQGHIAIDTAIFPAGTTGGQLDILARQSLWKAGSDYLHGTGHGVGSFLNVYEGPQSFGNATVALEPGHVLTNEPGYYKEGHWGIRIGSMLVVRKVETKGEFGGNCWLGFERFTQVPIQSKMIKASLLSKEERHWVKEHNHSVLMAIEPLIEGMGDEEAIKWLKRECSYVLGNEGEGITGFSLE